jgi:nicotinamide-nucleotide amidase
VYSCSLLAVGDELLDGRVNDTNSEFITEKLEPLGIAVALRIIVGDDNERIGNALSMALMVSEIVIITGGLGPTEDDLTREAVADALGLTLSRDGELEENLKGFFAAMGRQMSPTNLKQADLIEGAEPLTARLGTAPGQWIEHEGKMIAIVPGVPREMRDMIENDVIPRISERLSPGEAGGAVTLLVAAKPESEVAESIQKALAGIDGIKVSYRAMVGQIEVRLTSHAAGAELAEAEKRAKESLGPWVVAEGDETLEGNLGRELRSRGLTLAVAESCTGGMVGERITRAPGSSEYFRGGVIAYNYDAKERLLGVGRVRLEEMGAVNEEVAKEMAVGVRQRFSADLGVSLTGVAGPESGGEDEPVGTVAFGIADENNAFAWKYRLPGDRQMIRQFATTVLLAIVYFYVRGEEVGNVR